MFVPKFCGHALYLSSACPLYPKFNGLMCDRHARPEHNATMSSVAYF